MLLHRMLICVFLAASLDFVLGIPTNVTGQENQLSVRDDYIHMPGIGYYKLHTRALVWNEARRICRDEGAHLAVVNSVAEAKALQDIFVNSDPVRGSEYPYEAYVGIHDMFKEGDWITIFGDRLATAGYSEWTPHWNGQPDNAWWEQNCGALLRWDAKFDDVYCYHPYGFFCELPIV